MSARRALHVRHASECDIYIALSFRAFHMTERSWPADIIEDAAHNRCDDARVLSLIMFDDHEMPRRRAKGGDVLYVRARQADIVLI